MNWFFVLVRSVGASVPFASSVVQFNSELNSREVQERLLKLEDPISALHADVKRVSKILYEAVSENNSTHLNFSEQFYEEHRRVLALLEGAGLITGNHTFGGRYAAGILVRPFYLLYMSALYEDSGKMDQLIELVDKAPPSRWLHGREISADFGLPLPTVDAIFRTYESRGLGICSNESGAVNYYPQA